MLSEGKRAGFGYLVAGLAAGPARLGVVPPAVDAPILVEVDEVHQQLPTRGTAEALRVPARPMAGPRREHRHVPSAQPPAALRGQGRRGSKWRSGASKWHQGHQNGGWGHQNGLGGIKMALGASKWHWGHQNGDCSHQDGDQGHQNGIGGIKMALGNQNGSWGHQNGLGAIKMVVGGVKMA